MLALGGREATAILAPTPEVFTQNVGWRTLGRIDWQATIILSVRRAQWRLRAGHDGNMFYLNPPTAQYQLTAKRWRRPAFRHRDRSRQDLGALSEGRRR
jgi:hypothetical protein